MIKNKKSLFFGVVPLVVLALSVFLFFVVFVGSSYIFKMVFKSSGDSYTRDFEGFVDDINRLGLGVSPPDLIKLKKKSAIIGFSKGADIYECIDCYSSKIQHINVLKPQKQECENNACVCLCIENFQFAEYEGDPIKYGFCPKFECKELEQNIIEEASIPGGGYWKNGFLFANDVSEANGLRDFNPQIDPLIVEKRQNIVGICSRDMLEYRAGLGFDSCIITAYDLAKKLEGQDKPDEAIEKYSDFIANHESGREVENSLFRIGNIYMEQNKYQLAENIFLKLVNEHPNTHHKTKSIENLNELGVSVPEISEEDDVETETTA
ncbi:hypothetical protein CMO94_02515 [Candidatus Woesearchaeota archaeon]|jgi:tetratricopeptide (TPR) repeat protein|nr:hypothetical protein [Candidatus Woesearchaeota archaeon]